MIQLQRGTKLYRIGQMLELNVRFGSEADMCVAKMYVRFAPEATEVVDIVGLCAMASKIRPTTAYCLLLVPQLWRTPSRRSLWIVGVSKLGAADGT